MNKNLIKGIVLLLFSLALIFSMYFGYFGKSFWNTLFSAAMKSAAHRGSSGLAYIYELSFFISFLAPIVGIYYLWKGLKNYRIIASLRTAEYGIKYAVKTVIKYVVYSLGFRAATIANFFIVAVALQGPSVSNVFVITLDSLVFGVYAFLATYFAVGVKHAKLSHLTGFAFAWFLSGSILGYTELGKKELLVIIPVELIVMYLAYFVLKNKQRRLTTPEKNI